MSKDPAGLIQLIKDLGGYSLRSGGPIKYHIGADFKWDENGMLTYGCTTYINHIWSLTTKECLAPKTQAREPTPSFKLSPQI